MGYIKIADEGSLGLTAYWLGGNDLHREGSWVWPSGQPFTYTNWVEGEPDDQDGKEDCIAIDSPKEYKWMDLNCTEPMHGAVTHFTVRENPRWILTLCQFCMINIKSIQYNIIMYYDTK